MAFALDRWTRLEAEGIGIYVDPERPDWFVPNDAGDKLLQQLQRGALANGDVAAQRFLERLPDGKCPPYAGRSAVLSTDHLRELWFHVTNRCNLTCTHCLFSSGPTEGPGLEADHILRLADEAAGMGCRVFALTGGEPLVLPGFERLVGGLLAHDGANVVILTNGTLFGKYAEALRRWPRESVHLQVSVDGLREQHDRLRGEGAFEKLVGQLRWLREADIPCTISMSVDRPNLDDMPRIVELAAEVGASNVHFMWYFVRGRGQAQDQPTPDELFERLTASAQRAEQLGVTLDNIDALKTQAFAPPGTRHDGTNTAWESAAIGPDGRLYPSGATVGMNELGVDIGDSLASAWRENAVLDRLRNTTAARLDSPLRFITGGGDADHSYVHSGEFSGHDPYVPLYEKAILWLIAREAKRQPAAGPPRLRLRMGEVLESCGSHAAVATTHNNCLLSVAGADGRTAVREFYTRAAEVANTDILNPVGYPEEIIRHVPEASRVRTYGCGSPVMDAALEPGDYVVDLGCGGGVECFIAARLVGREGHVTGVDMLEPMLEHARRGLDGVAESLGYRNLDFRLGYLEDLPLDCDSVDVILSNCVLNLSTHKRLTFAEVFRALRPGGRLVIADVVCETEPGAEIRTDDTLRGECIGGALTQRDLFGLLEETGFVSPRVLKRFPYREVAGHPFYSMTFEASKPAMAERVRVMYRGPLAAALTGAGTLLPAGQTREVSRDEICGIEDQVFIFDEKGLVTNVDFGDASGCGCAAILEDIETSETAQACCAPAPSESAPGCCSPPEHESVQLSVSDSRGWNGSAQHEVRSSPVGRPDSIEQPSPDSAGCCNPPETEPGSRGMANTGPERQTAGCMVCGAPLVYQPSGRQATCSYCTKRFTADALCENGHFVCDACHLGDGLAVIEQICVSTDETDMIALLRRIRSHPSIPVFGPEHHAMVPGIILTTYRNLGGDIDEQTIRTGIQRGSKVPGGACGYMGICGAAVGVGVAFGLILGSSPVSPVERSRVQRITHAAAEGIISIEAARCCQREAFQALKAAVRLSAEHLPVPLRADAELGCEQRSRNRECIGTECPVLHP